MESVSTMLAGFQLALVPEVEAFWCENLSPAAPQAAVEIGKEFRRNKDGKLFKVAAGSDGHITLNCDEPRQVISCCLTWDEIGKEFTPEQPKTRYQVGSIEERLSNPGRDRPTICYYFCWNEKDDDGRWLKRKTYVPQTQMSAVWKSCKIDKRPYHETLKLIQKSSKLHHTQAPKL